VVEQDRPVLNPNGKATAVHLLYTRSSRHERGPKGAPDHGGHWQPLLTWDPAAQQGEQPMTCRAPLVTVTPSEPVDDDGDDEPELAVESTEPPAPAVAPESAIDLEHSVAKVAVQSRSTKSASATAASDLDDGANHGGDAQRSSNTDDDRPASTEPRSPIVVSSHERELLGQPLAGVFLNWLRASFDVMTSLGSATRIVRVGDRVRSNHYSARPIKKMKIEPRDDTLSGDDLIIVAITSYDDGSVPKSNKGPGCAWVVCHARLSSERPIPISVSNLGALVSRPEPITTAAAVMRQLQVAISNWKRAVIANPLKFLADARAVDSVTLSIPLHSQYIVNGRVAHEHLHL